MKPRRKEGKTEKKKGTFLGPTMAMPALLKGDRVRYVERDGTEQPALVMRVHDDADPAYYTVHLKHTGTERQTDRESLRFVGRVHPTPWVAPPENSCCFMQGRKRLRADVDARRFLHGGEDLYAVQISELRATLLSPCGPNGLELVVTDWEGQMPTELRDLLGELIRAQGTDLAVAEITALDLHGKVGWFASMLRERGDVFECGDSRLQSLELSLADERPGGGTCFSILPQFAGLTTLRVYRPEFGTEGVTELLRRNLPRLTEVACVCQTSAAPLVGAVHELDATPTGPGPAPAQCAGLWQSDEEATAAAEPLVLAFPDGTTFHVHGWATCKVQADFRAAVAAQHPDLAPELPRLGFLFDPEADEPVAADTLTRSTCTRLLTGELTRDHILLVFKDGEESGVGSDTNGPAPRTVRPGDDSDALATTTEARACTGSDGGGRRTTLWLRGPKVHIDEALNTLGAAIARGRDEHPHARSFIGRLGELKLDLSTGHSGAEGGIEAIREHVAFKLRGERLGPSAELGLRVQVVARRPETWALDGLMCLFCTHLSIGFECARGLMYTMIKRNSTIPQRQRQWLQWDADEAAFIPGAVADCDGAKSQPTVARPLRIFAGERTIAVDNLPIGEAQIYAGTSAVEVTFDVDANDQLRVNGVLVGSISSMDLDTSQAHLHAAHVHSAADQAMRDALWGELSAPAVRCATAPQDDIHGGLGIEDLD